MLELGRKRFNTDDGIRRATIHIVSILGGNHYGFNTDDGIRRATIFLASAMESNGYCFNTDDGIRRATILSPDVRAIQNRRVSIPMTVLGGLQ